MSRRVSLVLDEDVLEDDAELPADRRPGQEPLPIQRRGRGANQEASPTPAQGPADASRRHRARRAGPHAAIPELLPNGPRQGHRRDNGQGMQQDVDGFGQLRPAVLWDGAYNTQEIRRVERCDCKFIWCCKVKCHTCETVLDIFTCKWQPFLKWRPLRDNVLALFKAGMTNAWLLLLFLVLTSGSWSIHLNCANHISEENCTTFLQLCSMLINYGYSMHNRLLNAQVTLSRTSIAVRNGVKRGYPVAGQILHGNIFKTV